MHIFSYVVKHDSGFAPNPFGKFLTLATCKPRIRKKAQVGDYIVGTGSSATVGKRMLVYAGRISEVVPIADYGSSPKYASKRPASHGAWWRKHGDNIYVCVGGEWKQRPNKHHFPDDLEHDVGGKNVLVCNRFWYFGNDAVKIPLRLCEVIKSGRGHKRIKDESAIEAFTEWLEMLPEGRHGNPEEEDELATSCCTESRC